MVALSLSEARTLVRSGFLDDDGTRWTDDEVDTALARALDACAAEYSRAGGRVLSKRDVGTSTSSGLINITTRIVHSLLINMNGHYFPIERVSRDEARRLDTQARDYIIRHTPRLTFPSSSGQDLVTENAPDFPAFEHWVCLKAAKELSVKDGERSAVLEAEMADARREAMLSDGLPMVRKPHQRSPWSDYLGYYYDPYNTEVQIVLRSGVAGSWGY